MRLEEDILISELNKIHLKGLKQKSSNQFSDSSKALTAQEYQELQGLFEPSDHESTPQVQNLSFYQESECIRLIMNFGHMEINAVAAPGLTLTQYMLDELDDTEFQSPIFNQIFTICKNEMVNKNLLTPNFFLHHPEEEIQKLAIDFSSDKHILSDVWKDKHDIRVSREDEMLEDLAYKNVLRLRKVYNDQKLQEVLNSLEKADVSPDALNELLVKFIELKEIQKNISQELGTVIEK
jgi:DNA primase